MWFCSVCTVHSTSAIGLRDTWRKRTTATGLAGLPELSRRRCTVTFSITMRWGRCDDDVSLEASGLARKWAFLHNRVYSLFCFFVVTTHDHYSFGECGTISRRTRSLRRKQRNTHRFPNPMGNQRHRVYPSLKSCIIVSDNVECVNGRSIGHPKEWCGLCVYCHLTIRLTITRRCGCQTKFAHLATIVSSASPYWDASITVVSAARFSVPIAANCTTFPFERCIIARATRTGFRGASVSAITAVT